MIISYSLLEKEIISENGKLLSRLLKNIMKKSHIDHFYDAFVVLFSFFFLKLESFILL